jgi:hypothetical protein
MNVKKYLSDLQRKNLVVRTLLKVPLSVKHRYYRQSDGEVILKNRYRNIFSKELDTHTPASFTEKLFCKMLALNRKNDPLLTRLVDKHLAREWVEEKIGPGHLIELYWQGDNPRHIPFETLPSKCVFKTNHGSGQVIVKNGEIDREDVCKKLRGWLRENYYWVARENQYYKVAPTILIEEFLSDGTPDGPLDYRFWCFGGKVCVIQVDNHSHSINPFYDLDWNLLDLSYRANMKAAAIHRPENFTAMIGIAETLAHDFDFVRVDLYNIAGRILFGEMTFTPVAGNIKFTPTSWDLRLGAQWTTDKRYALER